MPESHAQFETSVVVVSLGAAFKGFEMVTRHQDSVPKMFSEVSSLLTLPDGAGKNLKSGAEAITGNFTEKDANLMQEGQNASGKFVDFQ